jgi:hypothetical protein
MPGNSDKSSEKPKPVQTVQTLLAAKNGNEKQKKKTPKRPNIEVSMDSSSDLTIELTNFQNDLDIIKDSLEGVVTKTDLDKSLADIVKKSDLETVVTSIVTKLLDSFKKEINEKISEKSNKQTKAIGPFRSFLLLFFISLFCCKQCLYSLNRFWFLTTFITIPRHVIYVVSYNPIQIVKCL